MTIDHTLSGCARYSAAPVQPLVLGLLALTIGGSGSARAALSAEELAKLAQNPIANLISVPFQNNTNLNYGPLEGTQNILNIQPVIPITLNKDWNLITRTIFPLIWQPELSPLEDSTFGLGDTQVSAFLSPSNAKGWIWGVGAIAQIPTHTDSALGNENWGLGPTAVVLHLEHGSPWVYGMLINNVWSLDTSNSDPSYNNGLIQPFVLSSSGRSAVESSAWLKSHHRKERNHEIKTTGLIVRGNGRCIGPIPVCRLGRSR